MQDRFRARPGSDFAAISVRRGGVLRAKRRGALREEEGYSARRRVILDVFVQCIVREKHECESEDWEVERLQFAAL